MKIYKSINTPGVYYMSENISDELIFLEALKEVKSSDERNFITSNRDKWGECSDYNDCFYLEADYKPPVTPRKLKVKEVKPLTFSLASLVSKALESNL